MNDYTNILDRLTAATGKNYGITSESGCKILFEAIPNSTARRGILTAPTARKFADYMRGISAALDMLNR